VVVVAVVEVVAAEEEEEEVVEEVEEIEIDDTATPSSPAPCSYQKPSLAFSATPPCKNASRSTHTAM
jgi:hypothetical protein